MLTKELIEAGLPPTLRGAATQEIADKLNTLAVDPMVAEEIRNNFISYTSVLKEGTFKLQDYMNAVAYVSFKLRGEKNQDAYLKTFPDRYQELQKKKATPKDISAYVAAYNKNKLVNLILEQTVIAPWVLNQDIYQAAINRQYQIMEDEEVSAKVRSDAANSLLTHLARPKEAAPALSLTINENSGVKEMRDMLVSVARESIAAIQNGVPTKQIAAQRIIDLEPSSD